MPRDITQFPNIPSLEELKWLRFCQFFLIPLVTNITNGLLPEDPDKSLFSQLAKYKLTNNCMIYPEEIMEIFNTLCCNFNSLARANSPSDEVTKIFLSIVGPTANVTLLNFSTHINDFFQQNPTTTSYVINELYGLRNYHLIRQELLAIYHDDLILHHPIEDRLPTEILQLLDIIPLFPQTGIN